MATVRRMDQTSRICHWCSTPIPPDATACPKCGAAVEGAVAADIPGLTAVDPKSPRAEMPETVPNPIGWLRAGKDATAPNAEAFRPPSDAVRREMRRIELEAQIENAGTELMNPTGDESLDAGPPSEEAIEALESGLLHHTGPAGETNMTDLAGPYEGADSVKPEGSQA
jgi:hypothetical protein